MNAATNAKGTAAEEQEKWIQSLQGHLEQLGAAWEALSNSFINSDFLKGLVDGITSIVNVLDYLIDKFGVLPTLGLSAGVLGIITNFKELKSILLEISSVNILESISKLKNVSRAIDGDTGLLTQASLNGMVASLDGLSLKQANVALSTTALTEAEKQQVLVAAGLAQSQNSISMAMITRAFHQAGLTAETQASIMQELGLQTAIDTCTAAELRSALIKNGVTAATADEIVANAGLAASNTGTAVSFKALTASITTATTAIKTFLFTNPVGWAILAVGAIFSLVKIFDALTESMKEAKEKAAESRKEYETTTSELTSLNSELETTKKRIDELQAKGSLSIVEKEELETLKQQNNELERQKTIKEQIAAMQKKEAAEDANHVLTKKTRSILEWINDQFDKKDSKANKPKDMIERTKEKQRLLNQYQSNYEKLEIKLSKSDPKSTEYKSIKKQYEQYEKWIKDLNKELTTDLNEINTEYQSLLDSDGNVLNGYEETAQKVQELFDYTTSSYEKAVSTSEKIDKIWERPTLSHAKEKLVKIAEKSNNVGITIDTIKNKFPKLAKACEKVGINIQDVIDSINSTAGIINVEEVKKQLKEAFNMKDEKKEFDNFIDNLSVDDLKILYGIYKSTDTSSWSIDDFEKAILNASKTEISVGINIDDFINSTNSTISSISQLQEILNAQTTGESISFEDYTSEELMDYRSALEYVNGSMQINADKAREIARAKIEEQTAINSVNKELKQAQYMQNINQIEECKRVIADKNNATAEEIQEAKEQINICKIQNETYLAECDQLDVLNASLRESIDTYQEWKAAQNASESGDMFDDTLTAIEKIDDVLNNRKSEDYGRIGREDYQTSLGLILPDSISSDDKQAINQYLDSIKKFFTFNKDGERNGLNLEKFCQEAVDKGLMVLDKAGKNYEIAGGKTMADFANGLNLSLPLVQAMFGELEEFGGNFDWGDEAFDTVGDRIIAVQKEISTLEEKINHLRKQKKAGIDIDSSLIKEAEAELEKLKQKKTELTGKVIVTVETHADLTEKLTKAKEDLTKAKSGLKVDITVEEAQAKVDRLEKKLKKLQEPTTVEIQASIGEFNNKIAEIQNNIDIINGEIKIHPESNTAEAQAALKELEKQKKALEERKTNIETYADTKKTIDDLTALDNQKIEDKDFKIEAITEDAEKAIARIENQLTKLPETKNIELTITEKKQTLIEKVINGITGKKKAKGTARVSGTAKASGDWGNKKAGKTLMGELGRELVINVNTGKWHTVGDHGAEFVNLPKNAIVFNHLQTEDLLSKGFVASRALALASGNALASGTLSGNAMATGGIAVSNVTASTKRKGYYSSDSKYANKKNRDDKEDKKKKKKKKEKTVLEKFQDWIDKFFDWIEIKIKRQTEKIDRYVSKAENAKDAGNYSRSAKNYTNAVNATTAQITNEQRATKKYNHQANQVVTKAISMGVISKEKADDIKKQVRNGSMDISKYGKKIQEVIKDYQEWHEKSKETSQSIRELHNNIRTYTQDLKEIRDAQRDAKLEKIDTYTSIGTSGYTSTSTTRLQNSQLKYNNSQLKKQEKAYNTEVSQVKKDNKKISKSGKDAVNKALNSKDAKGKSEKSKSYKKALNNAKKAIKAKKAVSNADLKTIKSHSISVYNKLYAYNLSLDNLEIAKLEQATNVATTSTERFENTAKKYENKDNKTNDKISLLKLKVDNATTVKSKNSKLDKIASKYDTMVANDKAEIKEYQKIQNKSSKTIKNKTGYGTNYKNLKKNSQKKKNVKNYIKKAKNAAKNGKSIDANVIAKLAEFYSKGYVSKSFYEACINYNNALEHREEAEAQLEIDEQTAIQEKAAIGTEKFNNVEQKYTNKQNKIQSDKRKESIHQSIQSTKGHLLSVQDYQTLLNYSKKEEQLYTKEITALHNVIQQNLNSGYWTTASQEYIDAMNSVRSYEEEVLNCKQEQEELNNEIIQLPYTIFDKAINLIQSIKSNFQSLLSIKTTRGVSKTNSDLLTEIGNVNTEIAKQTEKRNQLWSDYQNALSNGGAYGGKDSDAWLTEYYNIDTEINNLKADVESLNNEIAQLPYETYEKALSLLDSIASYNKSIADLTKAQGRDLSVNDYLTQISDNHAKIDNYEKERIQAYSDYMKALASYDKAYGGMTSDAWLAKYHDLGTTINNLKADNEDIRDALRDDVYWRNFERSHKAAQALKDILSGIADLIDDTMLYDKNGNFTDYGVAQMANIVKQFETARKEVQNYTNDIQNLNKLYAEGFYNQDEFNQKLNEFQNGLFDAASSMKSYISEIIDMNKKLAESELDALFKLIDARNDALQKKKEYYDFDRSIKDKTKDIQSLESQIAALNGVENAESKAQKARLKADLADKKDDLNDTIMNHSFELSKDALDELKTILQDEFDERWDNIGQNLNEIQKLILAANELTAAQSHIVGNALNKLLSFYGIHPSSTDLNQFGNVTGYTSGTQKVDKNKVAWTQEHGKEIIIRKSDGAILTPLSRGDSVVPNDLTKNLFDWGMQNPQEFADSLVRGIPDIPKVQSQYNSVNVHLGNMVNIEGNVVKEELPKLKNILDMAYKHTVDEITKDARKNGIKA